ncbi:MAG: hypothetical protein AAGD96_23920 [Chloroflexota bacterium]
MSPKIVFVLYVMAALSGLLIVVLDLNGWATVPGMTIFWGIYSLVFGLLAYYAWQKL